jgi:hypothetical protein
MFERYTEKARRTIFFARYEASQFGAHKIETEHLLLGLLRDDKALAQRFLGTTSSESIRKQVEARTIRREKVSTSVDMPLSHECKRALAYGAEEGERLKHKHLGTEHLLLGLLREKGCFAAEILRGVGLDVEQVREKIAAGEDMLPDAASIDRFRMSLGNYLGAHQKEGGVIIVPRPAGLSHTPDFGVYAEETMPPFVCIEVISSDDRFLELQARIDDYLSKGVRYVWLLDPSARRAYVATTATGLREVKDTVLRTENPALDLPLDAVFT